MDPQHSPKIPILKLNFSLSECHYSENDGSKYHKFHLVYFLPDCAESASFKIKINLNNALLRDHVLQRSTC